MTARCAAAPAALLQARRAPDAAALSLALALRAVVAGLRAVLAIHRGLTPLHHREIEVALTDPHLSNGAPVAITIDYPHFDAVMVDQLAQRVARALAPRRLLELGRPAAVITMREAGLTRDEKNDIVPGGVEMPPRRCRESGRGYLDRAGMPRRYRPPAPEAIQLNQPTLKQSMLCSKLLFTWTEISAGHSGRKPGPNTTQKMGGQS